MAPLSGGMHGMLEMRTGMGCDDEVEALVVVLLLAVLPDRQLKNHSSLVFVFN